MNNNFKNVKSYLHAGLVGSAFMLLSNVAYAYEKPKIEGFILRGDVPSGAPGSRSHFDNPFDSGASWGDKVDGIVITAEWADLQKSKYGEIESDNIIDQAINTITKWNVTRPKSEWIYLKLRVFSGIYSPSWVGESVGSMYVNYKNSKQGTLPYFWESDFSVYWADFQKKLGQRYDNNPLLLDVALSGCMTHNAETMWRNYGASNTTSIEDLKDKGLTVAKDERCLLHQLDVAANSWKSTNISMAINGWKNYEGTKSARGHYPLKTSFLTSMVNHCKSLLGNRCIVGNNSVGLKSVENEEHTDSDNALSNVAGYGNETYVQTTTKADDIHEAATYAANKLHASAVELPKLRELNKVSSTYLGDSEMQTARNLLKTNNGSTTNSLNKNVNAMFRVNSSRAYAFRDGGRYIRYDISGDFTDHILDINGNWTSEIHDIYSKITASFLAPNNTVYLFMNDGNYYRYYYSSNSVQGPFSTSDGWPGISTANSKKIVGALPWKGSNIIYFFLSNGDYIKFDWNEDKVVHTVAMTEGLWPGLGNYSKEITGAIKFSESVGYIFLTNNRYIKYYYDGDYGTEVRSITGNWYDLMAD